MASSTAQKRAPRHDKAIRELARGFELTKRLQVLLSQMPREDLRREPAGVLSLEVLRSLTVALCILESSGEACLCSPSPGQPGRTGAEGQMMTRKDAAREMSSEHSEKRKENSRTELTATPYLDGHEWRKYGQKTIAGANFSRSYYRCTYSDVDGCKATKHVQQATEGDQNEPHMFWVKYSHEHTCRNKLIEPPCIQSCSLGIMERNSRESSQKQAWVSFGTSNPGRCEEASLLSFSSSSSSDQDEAGAPYGGVPSDASCWDHFASIETVLEAFVTGPDDGGSLSNPDGIINPGAVSDGIEGELLGYDCFFQFDLEDVNTTQTLLLPSP